ncbi:sphingosine-1-phosphate phosphatase 1 [Fopius arisanus]|uniref:SGPP1_0 protein n=1 Tax=Fopius arisanus TaxID=64838 RepID=A0A0C9R951_9HYME|nr:PREDICTED: sphingosine-1-phosphate phosphatase 1-like [Fopius arisanus]XP_011309059.1 PREDICTED: sphingosine-1-phosphate phosphatase 1-like [Fopius arisanus]XP_011309060.1 PREDICTED: sphingosine-1-phosphate phosphatase 1-like [Fopius arisanus]XP_011309061.1 PREDICTED: sphingosine-1-phosphate phosphatase 1-like [Fopius arisanus]
MWRETLEDLKDAHLVARIQEFFGVDISHEKSPRAFTSETDDQSRLIEKNGITRENGKRIAHATDSIDAKEKLPDKRVPVNNYFWYYLFLFGTELGDEMFYCSFIPFWFWNVDGAVGRRIILVWSIVMTAGQALKDILCWPRPACPPAVRLQSKWSQEYGMPSTHAMVGVAIPFGIILFTLNRYVYSIPAGVVVAVLWCSLICLSRLYLGMHTVLDIVAGLLLAIMMMIPLVPVVDFTDYYLVTNEAAFFILFLMSVATIIYYPTSEKWTPTRGDTAMVVSVTTGAHLGALINFKTGAMQPPLLPPPYSIMWPTRTMLGCTILRTILGFCCVFATKAISKFLGYTIICAILRVNPKDLINSENSLKNKNKVFVDLFCKYISCFMIGLNTVYLLPNVFTIMGIGRPTFYTEM